MQVKVTVTGGAELRKQLTGLADGLRRQVLDEATTVGAQIMASGIVAELPTDKLQDDVEVQRAKGKRSRYTVGFHGDGPEGADAVAAAAAIEFGRDSTAGGVPPDPFMRRAFADNVDAAADAIEQRIGAGLDRLVGR